MLIAFSQLPMNYVLLAAFAALVLFFVAISNRLRSARLQ